MAYLYPQQQNATTLEKTGQLIKWMFVGVRVKWLYYVIQLIQPNDDIKWICQEMLTMCLIKRIIAPYLSYYQAIICTVTQRMS